MNGTRPSALGSRLGALALALVAACARGDASDAGADAFRPLGVGDAAPAYAAVTLAGDSVKLGGGGAEPVTLVNVWATWCESCREEMADLEQLHRDWAPRGLRVVAVSVDRAPDESVRRFVAAQGMTFPVAHDAAARIQRSYAAVGVPSSYLLSRDGRVLWRITGNIHGDVATVQREVAKALAN